MSQPTVSHHLRVLRERGLINAEVGKQRLDEAIEAGADTTLASCPCGQFQLRVARDKKNLDIEIVELVRFCAKALGYTDFPDPHPEVQAQ